MTYLDSILLGIIQGITEFLPVSSTAHLTLFGKMLGTISADHPEQWTAYIAVIQLGTLLSVLVYFANDIWEIIRYFLADNILHFKKFTHQSEPSKLGWYIILGTIPIVIIGLLLKKVIEGSLTKSILIIAISLILWGILLGVAEAKAKQVRDMKQLNLKDALWIGLGQVFSLIPGSSRSGTTLTFGMFAGLKRDAVAKFSFLLSIPAVLASGLLELKESLPFLDKSLAVSYGIGIVFAFISGIFAIDTLLKFLKTKTTYPFVWYRVALGTLLLVLYYTYPAIR